MDDKEIQMDNMQLVKEKIRSIKDFPIEGIIFRDITTAVKDKESFRAMIEFLTEKFINKNIDYVAVVESRGFIFGSALAYNINAGCVLIRKPGKLPAETISEEYTLEYGTDKLEIHKDAIEPGKNVIIIDDLLATGGTVGAACRLLKKTGANVKAAAFIIELKDLQGREKLPNDVEVVSMIQY